LIEESTTYSVPGYEAQQENLSYRSTSFRFSLQILTREGFSVKGEAFMDKTSTVPPRTSRQPVPNIDQEYDGDSVARIPRSAVRFRSTQPQQPVAPQGPNTGPIAAPIVTHRVSGRTRVLLWLLLVFCLAFLFNGVVWPALVNLGNQLTYGTNRIASFDLDQHHFVTQETNNKVRIMVSSADGQHTQVLTTVISGAKDHALVTLSQDDVNIDVVVNGAYMTSLVPDGHGMYKWKEVQ